jgi:hypothetical protein
MLRLTSRLLTPTCALMDVFVYTKNHHTRACNGLYFLHSQWLYYAHDEMSILGVSFRSLSRRTHTKIRHPLMPRHPSDRFRRKRDTVQQVVHRYVGHLSRSHTRMRDRSQVMQDINGSKFAAPFNRISAMSTQVSWKYPPFHA